LTHGKSARQGNLLSIDQQVPVSEEEAQRVVDVVLKAGEISLHHGLLIHGSQPNGSRRRRCGLTNAFIPAHAKQVEKNSLGEYFRVVLVNGQSKQTNLSQQPMPFPLEVQ
jgi:ectoine hydroxylase-related dioxygenase (phytanoyl-CoA dioxygenase family)